MLKRTHVDLQVQFWRKNSNCFQESEFFFLEGLHYKSWKVTEENVVSLWKKDHKFMLDSSYTFSHHFCKDASAGGAFLLLLKVVFLEFLWHQKQFLITVKQRKYGKKQHCVLSPFFLSLTTTRIYYESNIFLHADFFFLDHERLLRRLHF